MHTLTPSRPQTHLFFPKQALQIQGRRLIPQAHTPGWQGERERESPWILGSNR